MRIDKDQYLHHINGLEEKQAMRRVLDLIEISLNRHIITYTDFLDPNSVRLSESILNRFDDIKYDIDGGFINSERKIISIYSWYYFYEKNQDSPLRAAEVVCNTDVINHRDVLGSLLGLGIVRDKVGDIAIYDGYIHVVLHKDIFDFVLLNLTKIKHENIEIKEIPLNKLGEIIEKGIHKDIISSSKRLDNIISEVYNISRNEASRLIEGNQVKLNYKAELTSHSSVEEGDLVSVRRKGRFRVKAYNGKTKKDRLKLTIFQPE